MSDPVVVPTSKPVPKEFTEVLPPWQLTADAWWFLVPPYMPWHKKTFPEGSFDPQEQSVAYLQQEGVFQGG